MSEDVNIIGVDLDNSSMWATQKTMEDVLKAVEKLADLTEKQKRDLSNGINDIAKTGKVTSDSLKSAGGGKKSSGNIFGDTTKGLAKFGGTVADLDDSVDDLASGPMKDFGKGLGSLTKKIGLIGGVGGVLMNQIGKAISTIKETVDAMRSLNSVGIVIEGDFMAFQESLKVSGTTIAELSNIASKYARTVGNEGLQAIVNMTRAAEDGSFQFSNYGLRLAEGAEFQAELLESQRLGGIFRVRDQKEQSLVLQDNIKRLTAYSKILNVSREDMLAQRRELKSRADVQRRFNSFSDEQREAANKSFNQFSDIMSSLGPEAKGLTDMMTTIIADPAAVNSEAFTQLASASPEAAQAILDLKNEIESGDEISQADIVARLLGPLDAASKSGKLEMLSMNDAIGETVNMLGGPVLNSLRNYQSRLDKAMEGGKTPAEAIDELANATNQSVKKATEAQTQLDIFAATIKEARTKVFVNLLGQEAANIFDMAIGGLKKATAGIDELGGIDYRSYLEGAFDAIKAWGESVNDWIQTAWMNIQDGLSSLWSGIMGVIDNIMKIPARIENYLRELVGLDPKPIIDKSGTAVPTDPNRPTLSQLNNTEASASALRGAIDNAQATGSQSDAQLQIWISMATNLEEMAKQMRSQRSSNANAFES